MDEVQSWWEVPAFAHFCYIFRAAFNLIYFEIGELEAAILDMQDPELSISLEQLILRLLQGCFKKKEVTSKNWEEKLHKLFNENCEDEKNPLENNAFAFLSSRSKVEALLKLCEFRLDADGALEAIKDIPSEDMQAHCIGKDSENNLYWYFFDERLYKEVPSTKKSRAIRERKSKSDDNNKSWSIVCHNLSDWETLVELFSKSSNKREKELVKEIKEKYLPFLTEVIAEKNRFLRKRFLELGPRRVSPRLGKGQAPKKLEMQDLVVADINAKLQVKRKIEQHKKLVEKIEKKKKEEEDHKKRAEEKDKKIQVSLLERACRAQRRGLMLCTDVDGFNSDEDKRTNTRSRNIQKKTPVHNENEESSEDDDKEEDASQSESEKEQFAEHSNNSESENNDSDKESNNSRSVKKVYTSNGSPFSPNHARQNHFGTSNIVNNSYGVSKWNVQGDSKGQKIHILRYAYDGSPSNKRLKPNESSYSNGPVTSASTHDARHNYYESHAYHPLLQQNLNSCSKVTSPQVIRIDFIKPPKPQVSR